MNSILKTLNNRANQTSPNGKSNRYRLAVEELEARDLLSGGYLQVNLISDVAGLARNTDPNLKNPWGIDAQPGGPFCISDNLTGLSSVVDGQGQPSPIGYLGGNTATIPGPTPGSINHPTGVVANITSDFIVPGTLTGASAFIFATIEGTISGWNPGDGTQAVLAVNNSTAAVFTGLALAANASGNFLYAGNFKAGRIDVFDKTFAAATLAGNFTDPNLPMGYSPFNIQDVGGNLLVAYALVNPMTGRDTPGPGNGVVDEFDTSGNFVKRLVSNGAGSSLNSPWGFALAPANFGQFSGDLLVGNFGDGHIGAFNPSTGAFIGQISDLTGKPIAIDKLWGLKFGQGGIYGDPAVLYFAAGIQNEAHGLFGTIRNHVDDIVGRVEQSGQWWVGTSSGSTAFTNSLWATWSNKVNWVDVQTADFNGDGQPDIAGRDPLSGQWWVGLSNGSSFTTSMWTAWNPNVTWTDVMVGDFNGDGKADLVGRFLEAGQWWVAISTGSSFTNQLWATWNPNVTWVDVNVGDFVGTGMSGIVGRYLQAGQWWVGQSTGSTFSTSLWDTWNPNVTWVDVHVGDFDGNGRTDIVGRFLQAGQWWVALSNGAAFTNSLWATWNPNVTWVDVRVGDFNGDGVADIVGRYSQAGQWWIGLSNGSGFTTSLWATWSPSVTWVDVQVGDFNGDGKDDITGRVMQGGDWWTGISTGSAFSTSRWTSWSPTVTWVDVHHADYT
jgi:uncharacterized protein (TIGR03118 family)